MPRLRSLRQTLWAAVAANPDDVAPKLALADHLDESGREADLSAGLRWLAANGKWPARALLRDEDYPERATAFTDRAWSFWRETHRAGDFTVPGVDQPGTATLPYWLWVLVAGCDARRAHRLQFIMAYLPALIARVGKAVGGKSKKPSPRTAFHDLCRRAAEEADAALIDFYPDRQKDDAYHDDGALHVVRHGLRAAFDVSDPGDDPASQNENARRLLAALGLPVTDGVLAEEDEKCLRCGEAHEGNCDDICDGCDNDRDWCVCEDEEDDWQDDD